MADQPDASQLQARLAAALAPDYQIVEPLRAGGMSMVFLARQSSLNRDVVALLIAVLGLYSVVRFTIAERHHEFGVRVALGATGSHLVRRAVFRGMLPAAGGIALGLLIAGFAGVLLRDLLLDVSPGTRWSSPPRGWACWPPLPWPACSPRSG